MLCVNLDPNEVVLIFFKHKKIRHFVLQFTSADTKYDTSLLAPGKP